MPIMSKHIVELPHKNNSHRKGCRKLPAPFRIALHYCDYEPVGQMMETLKLNEALSPEFFCSLPTFH